MMKRRGTGGKKSDETTRTTSNTLSHVTELPLSAEVSTMGKNKNRNKQQQQQQQQQNRGDDSSSGAAVGGTRTSAGSSSTSSTTKPTKTGTAGQSSDNNKTISSNKSSPTANSNRKQSSTSSSNMTTGGGPTTTTTGSSNKTSNINNPSASSSSSSQRNTNINTKKSLRNNINDKSLYQWYLQERQGIFWVLGCSLLGSIFGFGVGSGYLTGEIRNPTPSPWRVKLGIRIRASPTYNYFAAPWDENSNNNNVHNSIIGGDVDGGGASEGGESSGSSGVGAPISPTTSSSSKSSYSSHNTNLDPRSRPVVPIDSQTLRNDPSHPTIYAVLREAIVREKGGYVHPDLGILLPAPCGASRGLGMVRNSYNKCQTSCMPGIASEKRAHKLGGLIVSDDGDSSSAAAAAVDNNDVEEDQEEINKNINLDDGIKIIDTTNTTKTAKAKTTAATATANKRKYMQEEVLIKVPLKFQMTRSVALETLLPRISTEAQRKANLHELDDAALLTLLLAHERGVGRYSRWLPYIASLPLEPSCGYSTNLRPYLLDSIKALKDELGLDVNGWPSELQKATIYADRIAQHLARDYGAFIQHPRGTSAVDNISWALCQVASRGIGGSQKHGSLRLIPLLDLINHDSVAGSFVELTGKEKLINSKNNNGKNDDNNNDFIDSLEEDSGAFVIRSLRYGQRKTLKVRQELLVNYNVPHYSALDWFVSLGFVPPERWTKWEKMDAALPRIRRDGPFAPGATSSSSSSAATTSNNGGGGGGGGGGGTENNDQSQSTSATTSSTSSKTKEWDWHSISSNNEL